jgi:hypothetical protein
MSQHRHQQQRARRRAHGGLGPPDEKVPRERPDPAGSGPIHSSATSARNPPLAARGDSTFASERYPSQGRAEVSPRRQRLPTVEGGSRASRPVSDRCFPSAPAVLKARCRSRGQIADWGPPPDPRLPRLLEHCRDFAWHKQEVSRNDGDVLVVRSAFRRRRRQNVCSESSAGRRAFCRGQPLSGLGIPRSRDRGRGAASQLCQQ